jgi:hypothetical protein
VNVLDVCSGEFGWARAFAARGHHCVGIDLKPPGELPEGCSWWDRDLMDLTADFVREFDFAVASTPCEEFAVFRMRHFHPNPRPPVNGIRFFNHIRNIFNASGIPWVMENVGAAQEFIGYASAKAGPFYLWGTAVPALLPRGITKSKWQPKADRPGNWSDLFMGTKSVRRSAAATIPLELASTVCCTAEWLVNHG